MAVTLPPRDAAVSPTAAPDAPAATLPPAARAVLAAAVARIVPAADPSALAARVERLLATQPADRRREVARGLRLLGSRLAALAAVGRAAPFAALDAAAQDRLLATWGASAIGTCRTVFQLVRRLALLAHYTTPAGQRAAGYRGPLWDRAPALPFEGPAPGITDHDAEPVLRADAPWVRTPSAAPLPWGVHTAATLRGDVRLVADAIVIGTGAGGAVAATRLAEAGKRVVLLEAGEWLHGADFDEHEAGALHRLYAGHGLRATDDLGVAMLQGGAVGGGTTVNWMIMLRTPAHVLDEWTRRFGLEGMDAAAMRPVFERIEREVHARPVPPDAHSRNNRILLDGARALGWSAVEATVNARGCVRAGFCGHGCRYGAKQDAMQAWLPRALAAGAELVADATVSHVAVTGRGARPMKRVHATVRDPRTGAPVATLACDAPVVVVAAGAVETPLLLERSGMGGGGVGEWLRLHPTTAVVGVHDDEVYGAAGMPLTVMVDEFARGETGYGFWLECPPLHPGLAAVALPGFGDAHARRMARFPRLATTIVLVRDGGAPDRSSGSVHLGRGGRARLRYALTREDAATVRRGIAAAMRLQLAAGAREAWSLHADPVIARSERDLAAIATRSVAPNRVALFSAHVNGTCRLGTDPRTSGCTPGGERHGVRGLHVMDGSLLPTGVGVNPQATIMAFASVLAERLLAGWRD